MAIVPRIVTRAWTPEEDSLLRDLHLSHTSQQISELLITRSLHAVNNRCRFLRLKKIREWTTQLFLSIIKKQKDGCWIWPGRPDSGGYGRLEYQGVSYRTHRFSYEILAGRTVVNGEIHHRCQNKLCVNPDHLEDLTPDEHKAVVHKNDNGAKTHCPHGHEYTPENTYIRKQSRCESYGRMCRTCLKEKYLRQKAAL